MNFFEQQLRNLTEKTAALKSSKPVFVGRACFITLSDGRRARLEFVTIGTANKFEALQITVINQKDGTLDKIRLRFADYFAPKGMYASGVLIPHIWIYDGKAQWHGEPLDSEKAALSKAAHDYIKLFA